MPTLSRLSLHWIIGPIVARPEGPRLELSQTTQYTVLADGDHARLEYVSPRENISADLSRERCKKLAEVLRAAHGETLRDGELVSGNETGNDWRGWQLCGTLDDEPFLIALTFHSPGERWSPVGQALADWLRAVSQQLQK